MKGSNVIIKNDRGIIYDIFYKYSKSKSKNILPISSHSTMNNAIRIGNGSLFFGQNNSIENTTFDILIGKSKKKYYTGDTTFQFESHRIDNISNILNHSISFIKYKISGENIGPYGN